MKRKLIAKTKTLTSGERIARAVKTRSTAATIAAASHEPAFREVLALIERARQRAFHAVNTEIDLYWNVGESICRRIASDGWGKATIVSLASYIHRRDPNVRGFSAQNLWRMRQFYETYRDQPKLSTLSRELSWSHNTLIVSRSKRPEEREFYLQLATRERWSYRDLDRQFDACLFERAVLDRLLALNHQRYAEELKAGLHDKGKKSKVKSTKAKVPGAMSAQGDLIKPPQKELFG